MKKINLSSTNKVSNLQLKKIMKEVAIDAKKKIQKTADNLIKTIQQDIKIADARFKK